MLITGGGGGLGRLLALRLARLEAIVVLWDVNIKGKNLTKTDFAAVEQRITLDEGFVTASLPIDGRLKHVITKYIV